MATLRNARLMREIKNLETKPPWGVKCSQDEEESFNVLHIKMLGPKGSPYERGSFDLIINVPERYPFEPPQVKFVTPVYHPNIDKGGRICMNMLKMPPKGSWLPTITIETLIISIQSLLANPNTDDPLMMELALEYKFDRSGFLENARNHTKKYAV
ncbi:ubiquitin-conjugating enzyme E2 T-like [Melitaea cinxia]|uniref:ubiquitin-conjugating enzyme E2 T-like n=1 Tax=Melitaea cinxia TaxID=113334 RepID=UPI001E26ECD6|nr:ubiquitin-conjugating enzyme E2 T-like [Melitaea cinxia]